MTVLIALAGVSALVWALRASVYHSPPVLPQAWQAACLLPGLLAACERRLGASQGVHGEVPGPVALPERMLSDVLARPEPAVEEDSWQWPARCPC